MDGDGDGIRAGGAVAWNGTTGLSAGHRSDWCEGGEIGQREDSAAV